MFTLSQERDIHYYLSLITDARLLLELTEGDVSMSISGLPEASFFLFLVKLNPHS